MPSVILKNQDKQRRKFVVSLFHETFCRRNGKCACSIRRITNKNGKPVSIKSPAGLYIPYGEQSKELPEAVLYLPKVQKALKSGWLVKVEAKAKAKAEVIVPPAPAPVEDHPKKKKGGN